MVTQRHPGDERPVALVATLASPWGPVHAVTSDRGLAALAFVAPVEAVTADIERRLHGAVAPAASVPADDERHRLIDRVRAGLGRWLAGAPEGFDDVPVDYTGRPDWDRQVLEAVRRTPWGTVTSYGAVATAIGRRGAARAVGGAVGRSPIGLVVPCHRVIAADGTLGGYGLDAWGGRLAGLSLKRAMLAVEGVTVAAPTD